MDHEGGVYTDNFLRTKEKTTVDFLLDALSTVKSSSNSSVLRLSLLKRLEGLEFLNASKFKLKKCCKYCHQPWHDGKFRMKLLPKRFPGKGLRKLLRRKEKSPKSLTKFHKKLLMLAEKNTGNKLVLECLTCSKKTMKILPKPPKSSLVCKKSEELNVTGETEGKVARGKKKKKKKDSFAGLNQGIVMKVASINSAGNETPATVFKKTNEKKFAPSPKEMNMKISGKNAKNPTSVSLSQSDNTHKSKDKSSFFRNLKEEQHDNIRKQKHKEKRKKLLMNKLKPKQSNKKDFRDFLKNFGNPTS